MQFPCFSTDASLLLSRVLTLIAKQWRNQCWALIDENVGRLKYNHYIIMIFITYARIYRKRKYTLYGMKKRHSSDG